MHGTLTEANLVKLLPLRGGADLYFDTGDCIKTGNLGLPLRREPVWDYLRQLDCTAGVLGNRETHIVEAAFRMKIDGASHPLLCANLHRKDGSHPLPRSLELEVKGIRVGLVGVMVPMVTSKMKTQSASTYLWDTPLSTAAAFARELRPRVDLLVALTHIGHRQDLLLAEECPLFDAILGGHSHTVLQQPVMIGKTAVCQGGSHNRFAGVYEWSAQRGWTGGLVALAA